MSFASLLSVRDRNRLRAIVRKTHASYMPKEVTQPSDYECDKLIDSFAPEVAQALLKAGVDTGSVG